MNQRAQELAGKLNAKLHMWISHAAFVFEWRIQLQGTHVNMKLYVNEEKQVGLRQDILKLMSEWWTNQYCFSKT